MTNFFKHPPLWFSIIFSIIAIVSIAGSILLAIFAPTHFLSCIAYALSAVVLSYEVYLVIYYTPKIKKRAIAKAKQFKFTRAYIEDFGYRSLVGTVIGFIINIGFALTQGIIAIITKSVWYGSLAVYYIALSFIMGGILFQHSKRKAVENKSNYLAHQIKSYRNCGIYITILTLALGGAITQMVIQNRGFKYAGLMIYVIASYTFYKLVISIINIVKAKKTDDYTVQSTRNLTLASALVSILALQTAMFDAFGGDINPSLPNALTGAGITLIIIALGLIMAISGSLKLKKIKNGVDDEQQNS